MGDAQRLRSAAQRVIDLVHDDDLIYLDALPYRVQIELSTPLAMMGEVLEEGGSDGELRRAVDILHSAAALVRAELPEELAGLLEELRFAGRAARS
ncbi:hypothetical protein ABT160_28390 [Streptomyces sp. NPDC001941]|uniref:hypothetical protein n=1 Tax=Streptomyces sp. NPDC001941 TaxID=3154659 RepID=UPI00331DF109